MLNDDNNYKKSYLASWCLLKLDQKMILQQDIIQETKNGKHSSVQTKCLLGQPSYGLSKEYPLKRRILTKHITSSDITNLINELDPNTTKPVGRLDYHRPFLLWQHCAGEQEGGGE